jgi:catechol 2,3-dioxygenase-like lactoylglutathione lyase family enzyme
MPTFTGVAHVGLSVTDIERSTAWYCDVLGFDLLMPTDEPGFQRRLLLHKATGFFIGLVQHDANDGTPFAEQRAGLDHLSLAVADVAELEEWAAHLTDKGVEHTGPNEAFYAHVIVLRDPDGIQLELFVRKDWQPQ